MMKISLALAAVLGLVDGQAPTVDAPGNLPTTTSNYQQPNPWADPYSNAMMGDASMFGQYSFAPPQPTCRLPELQIAGFRITTDTSDDTTEYYTADNRNPATTELEDICPPCLPGGDAERRVMYQGAPIIMSLFWFFGCIYSCISHRDIWACTEPGKREFNAGGGRPTQPGDAEQRPLRNEAKQALAQYRYLELKDIAEKLHTIEVVVEEKAKETLAKEAEKARVGFWGKTEAVVEIAAFLAHLSLFGMLLVGSMTLWAPTELTTDLSLDQCRNRSDPVLHIDEPCEMCPPIRCDPCASMLKLYPMCDVATGAMAAGGMGNVASMSSMSGSVQVPQHLQGRTECSPCLEKSKCDAIEQAQRSSEMDEIARNGMSVAAQSVADIFGDNPTFVERFILVQADLRPANCDPNTTRQIVMLASSGLSLLFIIVVICAPGFLPFVVLLSRTATKLTFAAALLQPAIMPSQPPDGSAGGPLADAAAQGVNLVINLCGIAGALIGVYATLRFMWELTRIYIPNAVMAMVKPVLGEHKQAIVQTWVPFAALNYFVTTAWGYAEVPFSNVVGCSDLCSSVPSFFMVFVPAYWALSSVWTSNFVTKYLYTRIAVTFVRGDGAGLSAVETGNVAAAAAVIPATEILWNALSAPFSNITPLYGAQFCCCCFSICPARRALLRYEASCLGRYQNFVLWRGVKDNLGFHDAALTQHADWMHPEKYVALDCRQHDLVCAMLSGLSFVVGAVCAYLSLASCESKKQATECFLIGKLVGSAISVRTVGLQ